MKLRADIVDMLRAGHSQVEIKRTLHVGDALIVATREALRMPAPKRGGKPLRPIETEFYTRTEPVDGGHLRWTGHHAGGTPELGRQGQHFTAYRVAFFLHNQRNPVGYAKPGCDFPKCVAPAHIEDRPMRQKLRTQLTSIFGGTA